MEYIIRNVNTHEMEQLNRNDIDFYFDDLYFCMNAMCGADIVFDDKAEYEKAKQLLNRCK